jgi:uncharacterized membrane protein YjjP (DUF1212 family)
MQITDAQKDRLLASPICPRYQQELLQTLPSVEAFVPILKLVRDSSASRNSWVLWSMWAFLFSFWAYLIKGMWRKALSIFLLSVVLALFFALVEELAGWTFSYSVNYALSLIPGAIVALNYKVDLFRTHVLNEKFWW